MDYNIPDKFKNILKEHQRAGFQFLMHQINNFDGCILADDMGLGKTIQIIVTISYIIQNELMKTKEQILIIVPKTVVLVWQQEFKKFANDINVTTYSGSKQKYDPDCQVIITTYDAISRDPKEFQKNDYFLIVADEAQKIKNIKAKRTRAVNSLRASIRIAVTGTPFENNTNDFRSLLYFIRYVPKDYINKIPGVPILRREKSILNLPPKNIINKLCTMTSTQKMYYAELVRTVVTTDDPSTVTYKHFIMKSKKDKKIVLKEDKTSTSLIHKNLDLGMLDMLNTLNDDKLMTIKMKPEFTQIKLMLNHPSFYNTTLRNKSMKQSGKMLEVITILKSIKNEDKVIIFSQYRKTVLLLAKLINKELNLNVKVFHGGHSQKQREEIVTDFQDPLSNTKILIISLKAGGTGLTLTAANHVIHFDLWWNPAVENQASDRVHRIGQEKPVTIYRLITDKTFEISINELLDFKMILFDALFTPRKNKIRLPKMIEKKNVKEIYFTTSPVKRYLINPTLVQSDDNKN